MRTGTVLGLAILGAALLSAQTDPPGRVARLNHISGTVSFQPAGMEEWAAATLNRPLTTGDRLWVDAGSRAELHVGSAALRLASRTAFQFLNLDDRNLQVKLTEGTLTVHLRRLDPDESFEVDTPNMAFALLRPGDYRIDADPDAQTTVVTVREGQGEGTSPGQAFSLRPNEQARVVGEDRVTYDIDPAPELDGWDRWCMDRSRREENAVSAKYVSRDVIGYEDLDDHGTWSTVPDYGPVWVPRGVPVGWAPYRYGHWAWVEPWGWTWVDDAPWGFAPFHYGRWAFVTGAWAWIPGPVAIVGVGRPVAVVRPVYSPALVAWVGGSNWGVSLSIGGGGGPVGWVPLGPREVYVPAYRASPTYVNRVNTTNTVINNVNVTNVYNTTNNTTNVTRVNYVNQSAPNAVTAVPGNALASGRPVNQVATTVSPQQLSSAQVLANPPVAPGRGGVMGRTGAVANAAAPPDRAFQRDVVARSTPPPAPVPFSQRRTLLNQDPGRPPDSRSVDQLRSSSPAVGRQQQSVRVVNPRSQTAAPGATATPGTPAPGGTGENGGRAWRRFEDRPQPARPQGTGQGQGAGQGQGQGQGVSGARPDRPVRSQDSVGARPSPPGRDTSREPVQRQRPAPVYRSESGERTPHPQQQQERKSEGRQRPREQK